jgi:hypothetical protein
MADITPARKLFDLLVSRDFGPEMLDSSGKPAPNPAEAELFSFDFRAESGKDYGTVVVMLGDDNNFDVYFGDNVGRTMEGQDKNDWFAFLHQLKNFAVKNFMTFSPKNINRLRYSMQGQAAIKEGLFESWTGTKTQSWNGKQTEARLMIKHKKTLGENDARYRYVESLFVETAEGERYKLPFTKLSGGRAMVEHVRNGGKPYDARGNHIVEIVNELNVLSRFKRANQGKIFEGDTAQLVEQTNAYYETAQRTLKNLSTHKGYSTYFESWNPAEVTEEEMVIEGLKHLFVTQSIDTRIESALPLLAKIQQQGTAMKEANIFEAWADRLVEGTWQTPDTPEKQQQLLELMSTELPVGADATNVTEQLYDLLGDDQLFDQLQELADRDPNADARQVVIDRMQELSDDPSIRRVIEQLNIDATAEMNPAEPTNPADLEPMNESRLMDAAGETIDHVLNRFKAEVRNFEQGGDLDKDLYDALFDYYFDRGEIPYGIAKARDGDPMEWVATNLESHLRGGGLVGGDPDEDYGLERESVEHGDYAEEKNAMRRLAGLPPEETDEGVLGTVGGAMGGGFAGTLAGGALGGMLGGPAGAVLGATAGQGIGTAAGAVGGQELTKGGSGIIEDDDEEMEEGWKGSAIGGALGGIGGEMVGSRLGPIGSAVGGALGGAAGAMIGDKLGGPDEEEQLNEVIGPLLAAGAKALMPLLSKIGPALGRMASTAGKAGANVAGKTAAGVGKGTVDLGKSVAQSAAQNAGAIGVGVGAYQAITDTAKSLVGGVGEVYQDIGSATDAITKMVGNSLDSFSIKALADAAVKYAIPIGILLAVLYGGKKIIDSIFSESMEQDDLSLFDDATCNMTEAGENCSVHGMEECYGADTSPLAGQYGHSGKMKAVSKDLSFLDRLKELSGLNK